jgi:hypothetical protein
MQVRTQPALPLSVRRDLRTSALIALCASGLMCITGCGSSGTTSSTPPPPTASSSGLTIYPSTASVAVGAQVIFTGYVPSQPSATVTWAVSGSSNGSITTNSAGQGVYTAPTSIPSPAQVAITATSGSFSATAVVTIAAAQGVTVSPAAAAIPAGSQATFEASLNGTAATGVTWEVNGTAGGDQVHGTIDASGTYSAPLSPPPGGSTVITAIVGGGSGTATATVVYSNASLNGNYSFSYTGDDGSGFLGITGEFTAASGNITGTEDFLDASSGPSTGQSLSGTYSIGPDGRGIVDLTSSTGEVWLIALSSSEHALLINFNQGTATTSGATGSGTIDQQTGSTPLATGRYVFQLAGLDENGFSVGVAGAFSSFGNGELAPMDMGNVMDTNDSGTVTTDDTSLTGTFSGNTLSLQSTAFQSVTGGTATFAFFVANSNHLRLIETDGNALMVGDIFAAPAAPAGGYTGSLLPSGNYAFTLGGATQSPYAAGGVFISNGGSGGTSTSGSITGGIFDNNNGGVHFQSDATLKSSTYAVDQNNGRISSSITTAAGTFDWVGYVTSPVDPTSPNSVEVLMLESDSNATASGIAYLQSSTAQPTGSFAFNLTGQATGNSAGEQDVLAQLAISGTALSGTMDINNFALAQLLQGLNILSDKSTLTSTDGNGRGTMTVVAADGASFPLAYYVIDSSSALFIETDSQRVMTGMMLKQF